MASVEEGCWFTVVGAPATSRIAEASPRCGGEASVAWVLVPAGLVPSKARGVPRCDVPYGVRRFLTSGKQTGLVINSKTS